MVIAEQLAALYPATDPCSVDRVIGTPSLGQVNQLRFVVPIGNPPHGDDRGRDQRGCDQGPSTLVAPTDLPYIC